jgi:hypothetical protein
MEKDTRFAPFNAYRSTPSTSSPTQQTHDLTGGRQRFTLREAIKRYTAAETTKWEPKM